MHTLQAIFSTLNSWVWGPPMLILLTLVGLHLTFQLRALQVRHLWYALKISFTRQDDRSKGDISQFSALMTALAATIGIGSITGVATAVAIGGLGAIFWMWVAAFLGMIVKFAEAILAIKYRVIDERNEMCGGPMYYLEKATKTRFLAITYAICGIISSFGTGNLVQSNSVVSAFQEIMPVSPLWVGLFLMIITGIPLIGGIQSISRVATILVPVMAAFYLTSCLIVLAFKWSLIPGVFHQIFTTAFTGAAAKGGFIGSTLMIALQMGYSRGIFSSEAGMGTSSVVAAAAKTDSPGRQALISMCTVFITTGIVCTFTGLVIGTTDVLGKFGNDGQVLNGSALAIHAFDAVIPYGGILVTLSLIPFAYSTILGWAYFGEKAIEYLLGIWATIPYRFIFTGAVFLGSLFSMELVWDFANVMNGLMSFPNLFGLFLLTKVIVKETDSFEAKLNKEMRKKCA